MLEQFNEILAPGKRPKILVVGDIILDEYLTGAVGRISPEAPVPVLESTTVVKAPGGAANVAANLSALGCEVTLCGLRGDDSTGADLVDLLSNRGIKITGVIVDPSRPTTHKLRVLAQGQHVLRIDRESKTEVDSKAQSRMVQFLEEYIPQFDGIICSDYQKGVLQPDILSTIFKVSAAANKRVVVDPKGRDYERYKGAYALTPNISEMEAATGRKIQSDEELDAAAAELFEWTGIKVLLATQGKAGMMVYTADQKRERIPTQAREVYDVTGAGDTVTAVLGIGLFGGSSAISAAQIANCAAGLVVGKLGTATVSRADIFGFLNGRAARVRRKLVSLDVVKEVRAAGRRSGKTVVFTNGCFDLLHAGHVQYLQEARDEGDLLILGLNTDVSVRRMKGPNRPVVGQEDRALVLGALECVDYIILFDEPTPAKLIEALLPDVLVKGADYEPDEVVGKEVVEQTGGRLKLIRLAEGRSTTGIVERIQDANRVEESDALQ